MLDRRLWVVVLGLWAAGGCSDSSSSFDAALPDTRAPDSYRFQLDTSPVVLDGPTTATDGPVTTPDGPALGPEGGIPDGAPGVLRAPLKLTFESTNGGLTHNNKDWEWGKINFKSGTNCGSVTAVAPTAGKSGMGMWGTVLNDCHKGWGNADTITGTGSSTTCTNKDPNDDSILTLKVYIPSTYTYSSLIFYEWADVNYGYDWHEIRINGKVVKATPPNYKGGCRSGYTAPTGWVKQLIPLDFYVGKTVTITFHFMATKSVNQAGWYLDDMEVTAVKGP